jgi:uncharacterized coiled-coil protein SlyX
VDIDPSVARTMELSSELIDLREQLAAQQETIRGLLLALRASQHAIRPQQAALILLATAREPRA